MLVADANNRRWNRHTHRDRRVGSRRHRESLTSLARCDSGSQRLPPTEPLWVTAAHQQRDSLPVTGRGSVPLA